MTELELTELVRNLIAETRALRSSVQELAARSVQSDAAIARSKWNIRIVAAIAVLGLAVGGVVFAVRTEGNQRQIQANARALAVVVYQQCVIQDETAARQIALIDSALATERRKPHPDKKRIENLTKFRPSRVDCGKRP